MPAITVVCVLSAVSAVVPVVEHLVGAALIVAALGSAAVAVIRRELHIRRRLADIAPPSRQVEGRNRPPRPSSQPAASAALRTRGTA